MLEQQQQTYVQFEEDYRFILNKYHEAVVREHFHMLLLVLQ